ncbi:hypothetical protein EDB19DRAFT_1832465 [Suillus lakei]|nr:hypothetical protein EDB19DRAFT_1832465 [Suillus lakei]
MPKQNKSVLQKQYRNKELDGFSLVRTEIRHATGGEIDPKTRQDVLRKAARLIKELSVLNKKLQHQLYKSRPGSETPSYVGGLPTTISSPCTQGPYSPVLYEYFIEQPNNVCQLAGIPPIELHSFVPRTGYELCDANMSLGNMGTTPANGQVISQLIPAMVKCYGSNYKVNRMWILRLCHEAGCVSRCEIRRTSELSHNVFAFAIVAFCPNRRDPSELVTGSPLVTADNRCTSLISKYHGNPLARDYRKQETSMGRSSFAERKVWCRQQGRLIRVSFIWFHRGHGQSVKEKASRQGEKKSSRKRLTFPPVEMPRDLQGQVMERILSL